MCRVALFAVVQNWKQPCPSMGEFLNNSYTYIACNTTQQWKETSLLMNVTTWMTLKCTVLSEKSQSQKGIYCMITFI